MMNLHVCLRPTPKSIRKLWYIRVKSKQGTQECIVIDNTAVTLTLDFGLQLPLLCLVQAEARARVRYQRGANFEYFSTNLAPEGFRWENEWHKMVM